MGINLFLNDYYDLLKLMHNNEAIILNEKIIQLTQQQIASTLKCSKMKVNSMFGRLQKESFVEQRARGKYVLTEKADKSSEEKINKPIMLLGKIQSGKTRVYTGVIALAFDNGFDMVFILSKNSKSLINQIVSRMKKEFKEFISSYEVVVSDIMKSNTRISGYQLE